ncbi:carbohydrate ABC transporter permease [Hyphomicrobium sp.]|uniref:carbohydrate ABC transporter permease n=1 Tax=Hyphomicrobium sp. TaxID=82 RepID=UPI001D37A531|nr:carbohydrate ABC transporter permease [Hyphomicrobium sp.]MBY0561621.1 carbohydrate ABC transporter permease [Hyphomicrobium sp.]
MRTKSKLGAEWLMIAANVMLVALFIFPLAWMVLGSFKSDADLLSPSPVWFFSPTLDHWRFILSNWDVERHLTNSVIVSLATTFLTLALALPAAYGLSRFPVWRKDAITYNLLSLKMIPPIASIVPLFVLLRQVGLYDTYLVLILLNTSFQLPFAILVMKSFVDEIPREIDEAASVDGCSPLGVLWRTILPLSVSGLVCIGLFVFIFTWNEFLIANTMVGGKLRPLPPVVGLALTHRGILWGPALALGTVVLVPVFFLAFSLSRYMARGLTFGAVKG